MPDVADRRLPLFNGVCRILEPTGRAVWLSHADLVAAAGPMRRIVVGAHSLSSGCGSSRRRQVDQLLPGGGGSGGVEDFGCSYGVSGINRNRSAAADGGGEGRVEGVPAAALGRVWRRCCAIVQPAPPVRWFGSPRFTRRGGGLAALWVPRTRSRHATCTYSCTRPPSRSRRSGRTVAVEGGGVRPAGGCCRSGRWGGVRCSARRTPAAPVRGGVDR
jgi:hypothetical protein